MTPDGLQPFLDIGIYGRISTLELFRPKNEEKDLLLIVTERYKFCVLSYDSRTGEIVTRANGDLQDRISKPAENAQIGIIDPNCRAIILHIHTGLFKVIPVNELGVFSESFNLRYFNIIQNPSIFLCYFLFFYSFFLTLFIIIIHFIFHFIFSWVISYLFYFFFIFSFYFFLVKNFLKNF